mmetsp:Transcript_45250/g.117186  ORF Transcript_45250/g.117186 Transcript_45250/m.117186 type:complete len:361 (+) Transcript_45250:71-1153(+)
MVSLTMDRILLERLVLRVHLPSARREDVFVPLIPFPVHDLPRVALVFLDPHIVGDPHVVVHVEVEERTRLASRLVLDKAVEGRVVREDEIFLHVHQVVGRDPPQLGEVLPLQLRLGLGEELADVEALLHHGAAAMARAVPIRVDDLQLLVLHRLLLFLILLDQRPLLFLELGLAVRVVQKGRVDARVLAEALALRVVLFVGVTTRVVVFFNVVPERQLLGLDPSLQPKLPLTFPRVLRGGDEVIDRLSLRLELLRRDQADGLLLELLLQGVRAGPSELRLDAREASLLGLVLDVLPLLLGVGPCFLAPLQQPERAAALGAGDELTYVVTRLERSDRLQRLGCRCGHECRAAAGPPRPVSC